jgi:hypothetical protein
MVHLHAGTLVADSMVSLLMKEKGINAVVVGADRVVANGDTANKIGTYQVVSRYPHPSQCISALSVPPTPLCFLDVCHSVVLNMQSYRQVNP